MMTSRTLSRRALMTGLMVAAIGLLGACDTDKKKILTGERISVLQLQKELAPSANLQGATIQLPEAWTNQFWPQAGGYPNHAMGHLALKPKIEKAWSADIGAGGGRIPLTAAPIVAEGSVFTLNTDGEVTAFDLGSGKQKWRQSAVPRGEEESGSAGGGLAYASGRLYVTSGFKFVAAVNPETGAMIWKSALPSPARSAPTVMEEKVFVITLDNRLMAFTATDGAPIWNYTGVSETTNLLGSAAPAADPNLIVLPLSSGELFALRPTDGQVLWDDNLSAVRRAGALSSIADIRGLPVIDQGLVYAVSYSGRTVAIDQQSGRRLWQRELGSAQTPWPAGEAVFMISSDEQLVALSRSSGDIYWITPLTRYEGDDRNKPEVWTGPVLAGGRLLMASSAGELVEADAATGKILQKRDVGGRVTIAPVVAAGTLLLLAEDGTLTAWR